MMDYAELMTYIQRCLKDSHEAVLKHNFELASSLAVEMAKASEALARSLRDQ
jgi:hypothetical protein